MIPLCDLTQQYLWLKTEIDAAMQRVAEEGHYILGPNVKALEQEIASFCGCKYGAGVANGTDAIHLALRALNIGPGDEVLTTPFTFIATTEAIGLVGATPVFVDIDPWTFNIDPQLIEAAITPRTKVILPVHLYGQPCQMDAIMEIADRRGLCVVEDCAQAIGATYRGRAVGSFGDAGCISFFPSKNLGCFGDGGMVLTNNAELYERVEMLRRHGGKVKYHHSELGLNSRLDEVQAAVLRVKLKYLHRWNELRRRRAYAYNQLLADCGQVQCPAEWGPQGCRTPHGVVDAAESLTSVYHQYTILVDDRNAVSQRLAESEVASAVYYPLPLHLQAVHATLGLPAGRFPHAETTARRCLSIPMFPELTDSQQEIVVARLKTAVAATPRALRRAG